LDNRPFISTVKPVFVGLANSGHSVLMNLKNLSNTKLVKLCAEETQNELAWAEFYARFNEPIRLALLRECRRKFLKNNRAQFDESFADLVQEVYLKLVQENCKALRNFIGSNENAIYTYLAVIASNVVCGHLIKEGAVKRRAILTSLDTPVASSQEDGDMRLIDVLPSTEPPPDAELEEESKRQEFDILLNKVISGRSKERDILIFKLNYYQEFSPEQITQYGGIPLSGKRIRNIITSVKQRLAKAGAEIS
jgi:RNA polymerase sigma factor (sigma-70 family)